RPAERGEGDLLQAHLLALRRGEGQLPGAFRRLPGHGRIGRGVLVRGLPPAGGGEERQCGEGERPRPGAPMAILAIPGHGVAPAAGGNGAPTASSSAACASLAAPRASTYCFSASRRVRLASSRSRADEPPSP